MLAKDIQESCPDCQMTVLEGDPVEKVTSLARSLNADLIVIGSRHQAGFLGRLFALDIGRLVPGMKRDRSINLSVPGMKRDRSINLRAMHY